jgi:hypothetical protein
MRVDHHHNLTLILCRRLIFRMNDEVLILLRDVATSKVPAPPFPNNDKTTRFAREVPLGMRTDLRDD